MPYLMCLGTCISEIFGCSDWYYSSVLLRWNEFCIVFKSSLFFLFSEVAAFFALRRRGPLKSDQRVRRQLLCLVNIAVFYKSKFICCCKNILFPLLFIWLIYNYAVSVLFIFFCVCLCICLSLIHLLICDLVNLILFCSLCLLLY